MLAALPAYIARAATKLPRLTELESKDLAFLSKLVGRAQIVALGESFHHTHEQLLLRNLLARHLITNLGFNVILLEVVTPGENALNRFVRIGLGGAETALIETRARMWRNRETAKLIAWLRERQLARPDISLFVEGLDVLAIGGAMRAILDHIGRDRLGSERYERIVALSRGFDVDGRADQIAFNQMSAADRADLKRAFLDADASLENPQPVRELLTVVVDAMEMLEAGANAWTDGFPLRDRAMGAAAIRRIERADPSDKFIILSHNTHVAALQPANAPSHRPMGSWIKERFGEDYVAIGLAFGQTDFNPPIYGVTRFSGDGACADQHIAALNSPVAFVDLSNAPQNLCLRLAGIGVGPDPYTEYHSLQAFDALAYVDVLTNARQLVDTDLSLDTREVDATRASG